GRVHPLEGVAAAVAQPPLVHRFAVDAEEADEPVRRGLEGTGATDRALLTRRLDAFEIPRARSEPIGPCGERADRTDLHGVPGEVRRERLVGIGDDLGAAAAAAEVDERVAGNLGREPRAPTALDAALT